MKQKNILLVYPEVPRKTFWSFYYALKFIKKKATFPPLGLLTVGAMFPSNYNLKLIDLNVCRLKESDILWADSVLISAMLIQKDSFEKIVSQCNRLKRKVIAGGPYITSCYDKINGVDHFVIGEIENVFSEFLEDFEHGDLKRIYKNESWADLSQTPIPRYDLIDLKNYSTMSLQYSRGCPFRCEFCNIWKLYGNRPRVKSVRNILKEIEVLFDLGWRGAIFVVDDNFIGNKRAVKSELLPQIKKWQEQHGHPFRFLTQVSINIASDEELLKAMREVGFNEVFIGIETPSPKGLEEARKYQNLQVEMLEAVKVIQQCGIEVTAGFIIGFDSDTPEVTNKVVEFIQESAIPIAMVGFLIALPGTDLYYRLKKEGRILRESDGNNTHHGFPNFLTKMDRHKLSECYHKILSTIYDDKLKNFFSRCNLLLDSIGFSPFSGRRVGFNEVLMLFRSLFWQTFTPYGIEYLKFIVRNFIKNRKKFSMAIRFSIIGHHLYTITQDLNNKRV